MSPSKPTRDIAVRVPRHGAKRPSSSLTSHIRRQAASQRIRYQGHNAGHDPSTFLGAGAENASEWNSLLVQARAERGPQWDVASQMFHIDKGSTLYYDSTPLYASSEPPAPEHPPQEAGMSSSLPPGDHFPFPSQIGFSSPQQHHPHNLPQHGQGMNYMRTPSRTPQQNVQTPYSYMTGSGLPSHLQHQQGSPVQDVLYRQMAQQQQQQQQNSGMPFSPQTPGYANMRSPMNGMPGMMNGMAHGMMNGHSGSPTPSRDMNGRGFPGMF
ncbi:hypothetical protein SISSUDRAFT_557058 [Sistotremastrum suecicum HHB10207 ss-3]|uniref:Uncharacterized protein n=1 Tax=Sistotremastrum suecicum HHB10207 ss-3 TaxID=1314776 RepID=A0A166EW95_9AGAM|nr:hypothetical protein SISSUDRAFT_557058 [Sistotremastrum suecicum HHB10207 ss-3]